MCYFILAFLLLSIMWNEMKNHTIPFTDVFLILIIENLWELIILIFDIQSES